MENLTQLTQSELIELVQKLENETLQAKLRNVRNELKLLADDLVKAASFIYQMGNQVGGIVQNKLTSKNNPSVQTVDVVVAEVISPDYDLEFEY